MADEEKKQTRVSGGFSGGSKENPAKKLINSIGSALHATDEGESEASEKKGGRSAGKSSQKEAGGGGAF